MVFFHWLAPPGATAGKCTVSSLARRSLMALYRAWLIVGNVPPQCGESIRSGMRMDQPIVMLMLGNPMVFLAGGVERIDVDDGIAEVRQVMEELMPHFRGNSMPLGDRQMRTDGNIEFRMQPMPQPSRAHLRHLPHLGHVQRGVPDLRNHGRFHAV